MSPFRIRFGAVLVGLAALVVGTAAFAASAQAAPYVTQPTVAVSDQTPPAGGTLTVSCSGYVPGDVVTVTLDSVTTLGSATADASGSLSLSVTLPAGVTGVHTIVCTGATSGVDSLTITIGSSGAGGGGGGGLASTGVAVIGIGSLGVLLLIGGGVLLLAGKRRRVGDSA
jgi:hypothetical protein